MNSESSVNSRVKYVFVLRALLAGFVLMLVGRVTAQTYTTLHRFTGGDGASPYAGLILSGNRLYGTTGNSFSDGILFNYGTWFAINTDGTGFTNVHNFTDVTDGVNPRGALILSSNTLYGALQMGVGFAGTVVAINTNGTEFTNLYKFTGGDDGFYPRGGVILSDNTLYGTASGGGSSDIYGTVFRVNADGTGFTNLHSFTATSGGLGSGTNTDGANPEAGVILSGDTLYGTVVYGGSSGYGAVFALNTDGTGFTNLHSFTGGSGGSHPFAGLILSGNTLYGTSYDGGSSGYGTVFALKTDGTGFTNLHSFTAVSSSFPYYANSDGANPYASLTISDNTLYGTAEIGGSSGNGTVFALNTDGTGFTNLYSFTGGDDGLFPKGSVTVSGNTLYGTTFAGGGSSGFGTVFSLSLPVSLPQLTIARFAVDVVLNWPTNAIGFTLQSTTNLVAPMIWSTVSSAPVVVNGQNTVTNPISGTHQFYRLSK